MSAAAGKCRGGRVTSKEQSPATLLASASKRSQSVLRPSYRLSTGHRDPVGKGDRIVFYFTRPLAHSTSAYRFSAYSAGSSMLRWLYPRIAICKANAVSICARVSIAATSPQPARR